MSRMKIGAENVARADVEAVIIRADGTRINLGRIAYYNRNPILNYLGNLAIRVRRWWLGV